MATATRNWVGVKLAAGRYEVESLLGQGGMGTVYLAHDHRLGKPVVVKVPSSELLTDPEFRSRFAREARSLVNLEHPNIVRINDIGEHDGIPFLIMAYLSGGSLEDRFPKSGASRNTPDQTLKWLPSIADALDFIHSQQYVHRDVKPSNILFDGHENAYLGDFGIAKAVGKTPADATVDLTQNRVIGTPGYIAPEFLLGKDFDATADQYALATVVYQLLAGRKPFEGRTFAAVVSKQTTRPAPPLTSLVPSAPEPLSDALKRALSRDSKRRFATCSDFAQAVSSAVQESTTEISTAGDISTEYVPTRIEHAVSSPTQREETVVDPTTEKLIELSDGTDSRLDRLFPSNTPRNRLIATAVGAALIVVVALVYLLSTRKPESPKQQTTASSTTVSEAPDAHEIIKKGIEFLGGEDKISQHKAESYDETMTLDGKRYEKRVYIEWPNKLREEIVGVGTTIVNGDAGWHVVGGRVTTLSKEQIRQTQNGLYGSYVNRLVPLLSERFAISFQGKEERAGKTLLIVRVERAGYPAIRLFFDSATGAMARSEMTVPQDGESRTPLRFTIHYHSYESSRGIKYCPRTEEYTNHEKRVEATLSRFRPLESLDPKLFVKPTDPRDIVNKGIAFLGGIQQLRRLRAEAYSIVLLEKGKKTTSKVYVKWPDKLRREVPERGTAILNGKDGWLITGGGVSSMPKSMYAYERGTIFRRHIWRLYPLLSQDFELRYVGAETLKDAAVSIITAKSKRREVLRLFFDSGTGALKKIEGRVQQLGDVTYAHYFDEYRAANGIKYCSKMTYERTGKTLQRFAQYTVTDYEATESLDPKLFAKP